MKEKYLLRQIFLAGLLFLLFSCEKEELVTNNAKESALSSSALIRNQEPNEFFYGPKVDVGNGYANSWISLDKFNVPVEIGIELSPEAFDGLPADGDFKNLTVLPLPEVATRITPFNHIGLHWNPENFSSIEGFNQPHFGIYFFMISVEERSQIPDFNIVSSPLFNNYPPKLYMPLDYSPLQKKMGATALIGRHWLPTDPKTYLPLEHTVALGTYNGKFIFVNPITTLEFFKNVKEINSSYSQPLYYDTDKLFPTGYNIYINESGNYCVSLDNFLTR